MHRLLVGLTGGIGAGKSTVAHVLAELGAEVVSGDELGRKTLEESPELLAKIRERFGDDVFSSEGKLNRRALGERVFADQAQALWLTDLTFPEIHRRWKQSVANSTSKVVVFDAALIYEWGIEGEFDLIIAVTATCETIILRMSGEGRFLPHEIESRLASQIPPVEKAGKAHIHLKNDDTIEALESAVREVWRTRILPELKNKESERE